MSSTHVDPTRAEWVSGVLFYGPGAVHEGRDIVQMKVLSDRRGEGGGIPTPPRRHAVRFGRKLNAALRKGGAAGAQILHLGVRRHERRTLRWREQDSNSQSLCFGVSLLPISTVLPRRI